MKLVIKKFGSSNDTGKKNLGGIQGGQGRSDFGSYQHFIFSAVAFGMSTLMWFNANADDFEKNKPAVSAEPEFQKISVIPSSIIASNELPDWRDFRTVSSHQNGENILFVECEEILLADCRVLRLNINTRKFNYYDLPQGYRYLEAYISPSGKKMAVIRSPKQAQNFPENLNDREIIIMNSDGTNFEVLSLAVGPKTRPTFNASDDRLVFWRAQPRAEKGAKTLASNYDVWEYDLKKGKEYPFGASYRFFQAGEIHYLPGGDELLVAAQWPSEGFNGVSFDNPSGRAFLGLSSNEYRTRYVNQIFRLRRVQTEWSEPIFSNESFSRAMRLSLTSDGSMVFEATPLKGSVSIYRQEPDGGFRQYSMQQSWDMFGTAALLYSTLVGNQLIGIFNNKDAQRKRDERRFLILNLENGEWRALVVPPLAIAQPIFVTLK